MRLLHGYAFHTYVYPLFVARLSVLGVSHRGTSRSGLFPAFLSSFLFFVPSRVRRPCEKKKRFVKRLKCNHNDLFLHILLNF